MTAKTLQRTALITGASRGLGKVLAHFLAKQDYKLIITARGEEALKQVANELRPYTEVVALAGDVTGAVHRHHLVNAVEGGLELLVNNASYLGPSPQPKLLEYPLATLREVYESNIIAPLAMIQDALPLLKARQGLVINLSSDAAVGAYETWGGYGSSKAALDLISTTLAKELVDTGVSVVSVDPGDMRTQMHQDAFPGEDISDRPLPDVTLPFWAWLLGQKPSDVSGKRFQAQADVWTTREVVTQ